MWLARDFTDGVYQHLDSFLRQNERAVVVEDFSSGFVLVDGQGTVWHGRVGSLPKIVA